MSELPVIGAQLCVLDIDRHRDWLFEKNRDLELPEFCLADILNAPAPFIGMAKAKLDGWHGRLGIHGPFSGFELDVKDAEIRAVVQKRIDQALDVCAALEARQMVLHSPYDAWDHANLDNGPGDRARHVRAVLETLKPALDRAEALGVVLVLENIKDVDPAARAAVVDAADSPALRLSVDTGHALWAHVTCGAPPVDRFISQAGAKLAHIHLQDADGYADRHWEIGKGTIRWHAVFAALAECAEAPRLILELSDKRGILPSMAWLAAEGLGR